MSAPARRRPGGASPLLSPVVETIHTTAIIDEPIPATEPVKPPVSQPISAAPTPTDGPQTSDEPQASAGVSDDAAAPPAASEPAQAHPYPPELDQRKPTTLNIQRILKSRAETAVLRTAGLEGGYRSWNAFVEGAIQNELKRLADEFNGGEPFDPNLGLFRQGRPLGS